MMMQVATLEGVAVELRNTFTIDGSIDEAWRILNAPEVVAPCFPGATLTEYEGDRFAGTVKIKLGPISMLFKGRGSYVSRDAESHQVVIEASGRDSRGNGSAAATVTASMTDDGPGRTVVTILTDMKVTGRPAQLGRGVMTDVADRIIEQFATNLASRLAPAADVNGATADAAGRSSGGTSVALVRAVADSSTPPRALPSAVTSSGQASPRTVPATTAEPLDLGAVLFGSNTLAIRRAAPALAATLVLLAVLLARRGRTR